MTGRVYYNDFDAQACDYLENLIAEGLIPAGVVDRRSITDIQPGDLRGFTQCHFFAGVGGWALAALLAGWSDERPLWSGSCPCQPFSLAGQGLGANDERHLWPDFFRLIDACRPPRVVGEQVAGAPGYAWFDGVASDLGGSGYACRTVDIPAAAVDSPQIRQRLYWAGVRRDPVARSDSGGLRQIGRDHREGAGDPTGKSRADDHAALLGGRDETGAGGSGGMVDTSGLGRREGRPKPELWSGRNSSAVADEQGGERSPMACGAGELGGEQQPLGGPEGRTPFCRE